MSPTWQKIIKKAKKLNEFQVGWTQRPTVRHIIIPVSKTKDKEKYWEAVRKKQIAI